MFAAAVLCACQGMAFEREPAPGEEPVPAETEPSDLGTTFLDAYNQVFAGMQGGRAALIYLDRDCVPELLILKDGEYQMYFFDGSAAKRVPLPDEGMRANAYGTRYAIESKTAEPYSIGLNMRPGKGWCASTERMAGSAGIIILPTGTGRLTWNWRQTTRVIHGIPMTQGER